MRRFFHNALLIVFGLTLGVAAFEIGVRLIAPRYSPDREIVFAYNADTGVVTGPPNRVLRQFKNTGDYDVEVSFNRHGLRDPADIADFKSGDIVVLGDSFTFGWGVEASERFGNQLERNLGRRVFNLAAPGDLDHYQKMLAWAETQTGRIDSVVLGLCVENDVIHYGGRHYRDPRSRPTPLKVQAKRFLSANSALYRFTTARIHQTPSLRDLAVSMGMVTPGDEPAPSKTQPLPGRPKWVPRWRKVRSPVMESTVERVLALAEQRDLVVLIIPSRRIWTEGEWARAKHQDLVRRLTSGGITVVDPLVRFDALDYTMEDLHFRYDGHWRAKAHAIAASELVAHFSGRSSQQHTTR